MFTLSVFLIVAAGQSHTHSSSEDSRPAGIASTVLWMASAPREGWFGESIAPMGDLDGDGVTDLLVGNPISGNWGSGGGRSGLGTRRKHVLLSRPGSVSFLSG